MLFLNYLHALKQILRLVGRDLARLANMDLHTQPGSKATLTVFSCYECKVACSLYFIFFNTASAVPSLRIFFKVACSSKLTLDQHLLGRRHLRRVAQKKAQQEQQREPQQLPVFNCTLCDVTAPSQEVMILFSWSD